MSDTLFDQIIRGDIPFSKVYEDDTVLAFDDINPQAPVHVLVIPKKKFVRLDDTKSLSTDYAGRFFLAIGHVAKKLGLVEKGYRVVFNSGIYGQQSIEYVHAHILGGRPMSWPPG